MNDEVDEISEEDLEAASDILDALCNGSHYEVGQTVLDGKGGTKVLMQKDIDSGK